MTNFKNLEIHLTHTCNRNCESCSHFSGPFHKLWLLDKELLKNWAEPWINRIHPEKIKLLGGEPTLNPNLIEIIETTRSLWKDSRIEVATNGAFIDRFPELGKILKDNNGQIFLSLYDKNTIPNKNLIDLWKEKYNNVIIKQSWNNWTRRYLGSKENIKPFKSDPKISWKNCVSKHCRQLFNGCLWKCPAVTYIKIQKETFPNISPDWNIFLEYKPLSPNCSDFELETFLKEKHNKVCSLCPEHLEKFWYE